MLHKLSLNRIESQFPWDVADGCTLDVVLDEGMVEQVGPGEAMTRILREETLQEVLERRREVLRPRHWILDDEADELEDAVGVERRLAGEQLVEDAAESPGDSKEGTREAHLEWVHDQ